MDNQQIAHDLAVAYINNRFGVDVNGVLTLTTSDGESSGTGFVNTMRHPDATVIRTEKVPTGEKYMFGLLEKKTSVESGFLVDSIFEKMIDEYFVAYARFIFLLDTRDSGSN